MKSKPFISPTRGWVSGTNLAAAPDGAARVLENWFPTTTGIRMRGGSRKHGTGAGLGVRFESLMSYVSGSMSRMFGGVDGKIINMTSPADPAIVPAADVSGQTSNYYSSVNVANSGGNFMLVANGTNAIQRYDGAAWLAITTGANPATQISGVNTSSISQLSTYRNRVWMVEGGTMNAWYLGIDAIGGVANRHTLSGVFRNGGSLLFIATWSMDAGDGLDDKIVFVSTLGEVAVYQGDPAVAAEWGLVGRYDAAPPLGKKAFLPVGGDLLILTEIGIIPLSAIQTKDPAALALAAVSRNIQPDWITEARARRSAPWEIVKWTSRGIAFVSCPVTGADSITPAICFAVNLETGAWAKVTGWDTQCFGLHDDNVFFGTSNGKLMQADIGGSDDGALIYHTYVGHADHLGSIGQHKTVMQGRAIFRSRAAFTPKLWVSTDYDLEYPAYPNAAPSGTDSPAIWDVGLWDVAKWDIGLNQFTAQTRWEDIGLSGFTHAPMLLVVSGSLVSPAAELVMFELTYEVGGLVV
ncbi:hypothetical protein N8A98_22320 [Devosia neptuniae]|uniref:Uncharacterized protein n=1 Tax=Devosia neptuniae TaxID=191302 RepID=A0ABY6CCD5_9HYPH|nr:hypothetical protein [Devosia neptuniae]UXN69909.1 hypothetical protein N8A98_22320 [Devosia neptuniae]